MTARYLGCVRARRIRNVSASGQAVCSEDGCQRIHAARGLCKLHYYRLYRRGNGLPVSAKPAAPTDGCCGECGDKAGRLRRGLCAKCYERFRKARPDAARCSASECTKASVILGMCQKHYSRIRRNGTLSLTRCAPGEGASRRSLFRGYVLIGDSYEHRTLAEKLLGRSLIPGETVHHRNGVRHENTIGPCVTDTHCACADGPHNLELWAKAQPAGQRVADLLAFAERILALYRA